MYCVDFFKKFKKEGNFCGLDKSQVSRLNAYSELVELLIKQNISEEEVWKKFPLKAAEPLISAKGENRTKGLNYVTSVLKRGLRITQKDMQATLKLDQQPEPESCINATITEPKKKDPEKCFSPQPATITVTDLPVQPSLAEQLAVLPELSPNAPMSEVLKRDAALLDIYTNNTPEFQTADLINGGYVTRPTPYVIKPVPLTKSEAESKLTEVVRGYFTAKDQEALSGLIKCGELGQSYTEVFQMLIWDATDRMGAS